MRADRHGKPVVLLVTAGERHGQTMFEPLLEQGQIRREGRGRPHHRPGRMVGDKGYSSRRIRNWLRRHGIRHTIPHQRNACRRGPFARGVYRERNPVARLIDRLKQFRRVAIRYEKRAPKYAAMIMLP